MSIFFISYQQDSQDFARELKRRIEDRGMLGWFAPEDIQAGEDWKPAIDNALKQCIAVIVVVTPKSLKSQYVTYEWSFALGIDKRVIPLIRKQPARGKLKMHPRLDDKQNRDFINPDDITWKQLLDELWELWNPEVMPPEIQNAETELYATSHITRQTAIDLLLSHENKNMVVKVLRKAVRSGSPEISGESGMALAKLTENHDNYAVPGLIRAVASVTLRKGALKRLALINTLEAIQGLVNCLEIHADMRFEIMRAMAEVTNPAIIPELVKLLSSQYAPIVPVDVINALGEHKDPSAVKPLGHFLSNTQNQHLKVPIVNALIKINHEDAISHLYEVFKQNLTSMDLCNHILGAIREIGGKAALEVLEDAQKQNDRSFKNYSVAIRNCIDQVQQQLRGG